MTNLRLFDIDQHLCDLDFIDWTSVLPSHLHSKAPKNIIVDGVERLQIEDKLFPKESGKGIGSPKGSKAGGNVSLEKRLQWMQKTGIEGAILTPGNLGMAIHAIQDKELKIKVCDIYREWQLDQVDKAGKHCTVGLLVDPYSMPSIEMIRDDRVSCLYMRPTNANHLHMYDDPIKQILEIAAAEKKPILLHGGTGYYQNSPISDQYDNYFYSHFFSHTTDIQIGLAELIGHGLFKEIPDLKIMFVEAGLAWVPNFVSRLQDHVDRLGHLVPGSNQDVYQTIKSQCLFSVFSEDATGLGKLLENNIWINAALGSDYPHWDTMNVKEILNDIDSTHLKQQVAFNNAVDFLNINNV